MKKILILMSIVSLIILAGCNGAVTTKPAESKASLSVSSEIQSKASSNVSIATTSIVSSSVAESSIPNIEVSAVTANIKDKILATGNKLKITATISPADATNKTVTWASSDSSAASVDTSGNVTALKKGTTAITATSSNGKKCTINISIIEKIIIEIDAYSPMDTEDSYIVMLKFSKDSGLTVDQLKTYVTITNNTVFDYVYDPVGGGRNGLVCMLNTPIDRNLTVTLKEGPNGMWDKQEYVNKP